MNQKFWFTLVELIVVITIIWILSTVWFVSYSNYLTWARDSNRISQVVKISDSLQVYSTNKNLPIPDDSVNVLLSWSVIWYQWYLWSDALETIDYTNGGKDPKDDLFFTYYVDTSRRGFQLLSYFEENSNLSSSVQNITNAVDYSDRFLKLYWKKLWIVTQWESNIPIQEISSLGWQLDLATSTINYTLNFWNNDVFTASWYTLYALTNARLWTDTPACDVWFIGVPGNKEFNTSWFCVAQFEMSYADADTPNSVKSNSGSNSVAYIPWKKLVSKSWKYPIADISQESAIRACKTLWTWYHLINDNEWMTIARNIESVWTNWSSWKVGQWFIYNGVSDDLTTWCGITGWVTEPRVRGTRTGKIANELCNSRKSHSLSNGKTVWDMAWNLWEEVNKDSSVEGTNFNLWQTVMAGTSPSTSFDTDGIYDTADMKKYGSAFLYGTANGMWTVYRWDWIAWNRFMRWATASDRTFTWIYSIDFDRYTALDSYNDSQGFVWFRCAQYK